MKGWILLGAAAVGSYAVIIGGAIACAYLTLTPLPWLSLVLLPFVSALAFGIIVLAIRKS